MQISFIIPAYNEEKLLPRCVNSIRMELSRYDFIDNYEIIVVDNDSSDDTHNVAVKLGCRVVRCMEKGVTRARQRGFEASKYEYQCYVDSDNYVPQFWLANIEFLLNDDSVVAVSGPVVYFETSKFEQVLADLFYVGTRVAHRIIGPTVQGGNFMLKRSALLKAGGMPVEIDFFGEDTEIARRLSKIGKVKLAPSMWIYSSARRLKSEGSFKTAFIYALNYFSIHMRGRPYTLTYKDHRPDA